MSRIISQDWAVNDTIEASRLQAFNQELDNLYAEWSDRGLAILALSLLPLAVDIFPFRYIVGVGQWSSPWAIDFVLPDNSTNYIEVTNAWVITTNTIGFDPSKWQLAIVTTLWWAVTNIQNRRPDLVWDVGWAWGGFENITATECQSWMLIYAVADTIVHNISYYQEWTVKVIQAWALTTTALYDEFGCLETVTTI